VRDWRTRRRRSQLDLALEVGVSPRHLSFVETGRSRPSPELLLAVAEHLDVPLRERNALLLAAGYAPRYPQTPLDDASMARVRTTLQRLLDAHEPYPGVVIDRAWNVVLVNATAQLLVRDLPPALLGPPLNVFRVCLHPDGLAARTRNFPEWAAYLRGELHRAAALSADPPLAALVDEVEAYPNVVAVGSWRSATVPDEPSLLVPLRLAVDDEQELSLFTTLTTFGTPMDVTLSELAVELFYPADDASEAALRALPDG
jgi:transcriptional regulator with XRE-family HTH domain